MTANQEIELKLRVTGKTLAVIRGSPWWKGLGRARRRRLRSVYFDTPGRLLRSFGISLRTRYDGKTTVQTLKAAGRGGSSISRREWESTLPDTEPGSPNWCFPFPDLSMINDRALPGVLRKLKASHLEPLFEIKIERSTKETRTGNTRIEYAVDRGEVIVGDRKAGISEIELELLGGDMARLFASARQLNDLAPTRLHLRTKSETGMLLEKQPHPVWSRKPRIDLMASMSGEDALKAIALGCLKHLTSNDDCALSGAHEEGVHQCRVALRRLRSVLSIFRRDLPVDVAGRLNDQARWLLDELGPARDLFVLRTELLDPVLESAGRPECLILLERAILSQEKLAQADVRRALSSNRYGRFLIDLAEFGFSGVEASTVTRQQRNRLERSATVYAAQSLSRLHKSLKKRGRKFDSLSIEERHAVRIAVKRMRYGVDFFKSLYDDAHRREYSGQLAGLQKMLGRLNDVAVAESHLTALISHRDLGSLREPISPKLDRQEICVGVGLVLGWHMRGVRDVEGKLKSDWREFSERSPFWN